MPFLKLSKNRIFRISRPGYVLYLIFQPSLPSFSIHHVCPRKLVFTLFHCFSMALHCSVSHMLERTDVFLLMFSREPFPHLWLSNFTRFLMDSSKGQLVFTLKTLAGVAIFAQCSQGWAQAPFLFYR